MKKIIAILFFIAPFATYAEILTGSGITLDVNTTCLGEEASWVADADSGSSLFYRFEVDRIQDDGVNIDTSAPATFVNIPSLTMYPIGGNVDMRVYSGTLTAVGTYELGFYVDTSGGHYETFSITVSDCSDPMPPTPPEGEDYETVNLLINSFLPKLLVFLVFNLLLIGLAFTNIRNSLKMK